MLARPAFFVWLLLALECSSRAVPTPPAPARSARRDPPAKPVWPRFAEALSWPAANPAPFASRGHPVSPNQAVVRVSPGARDAYLELVTDSELAEGAVIAMFHEDRQGARRGSVYVMEKGASAWRFLALDASGAIESGGTAHCSGCHQEAVADSLFGLPRPPKPPAKLDDRTDAAGPTPESKPSPAR